MSQQILQVNFQFTTSQVEFENAVATAAKDFASFPGIQWKIWLINNEQKEAGGIYLFADKDAVENFKNSELFNRIANNPSYQGLTVKQFDIVNYPSLLTNAPLATHLSMLQ